MSNFYVILKTDVALFGVAPKKAYRVFDIREGDRFGRLQFLIFTDHSQFDWVGANHFRPATQLELFLHGKEDGEN